MSDSWGFVGPFFVNCTVSWTNSFIFRRKHCAWLFLRRSQCLETSVSVNTIISLHPFSFSFFVNIHEWVSSFFPRFTRLPGYSFFTQRNYFCCNIQITKEVFIAFVLICLLFTKVKPNYVLLGPISFTVGWYFFFLTNSDWYFVYNLFICSYFVYSCRLSPTYILLKTYKYSSYCFLFLSGDITSSTVFKIFLLFIWIPSWTI